MEPRAPVAVAHLARRKRPREPEGDECGHSELVRVLPRVLGEEGHEAKRFDRWTAPADADGRGLPLVVKQPGRAGLYRERLQSVCGACVAGEVPCPHRPELPLRLILLGHNPSERSFRDGYGYANPSNAMMRLLRGQGTARHAQVAPGTPSAAAPAAAASSAAPAVPSADAAPASGAAAGIMGQTDWVGLVPPWAPLSWQDEMPLAVGVGFMDVRPDPGSTAADIAIRANHVEELFSRMRLHTGRAGALLASAEGRSEAARLVREAVRAAERGGHFAVSDAMRLAACASPAASAVSGAELAPRHVAFTGMRQFELVFASERLSLAELRRLVRVRDADGSMSIVNPVNESVGEHRFPPGWPYPPTTQVWVLTSSSGRASAFAARSKREHKALASAVRADPWPLPVILGRQCAAVPKRETPQGEES